MFGFKSLAVVATLAFGALSTLAAPTNTGNGLVARCDCESAPAVWTGIKADIQVHVDALTSISKDQCTPEYIGGLVENIKAEVAIGVIAINKLAGQTEAVIMADADVNILAGLIAEVVVCIFTAIRVVLDVCLKAGISVDAIIKIFVSLGECLALLVSATISVTAGVCVGLSAAIYAKISVVIAVIVQLHISLFLNIFGVVL